MKTESIRLISVNVAEPELLGERRGQLVQSGIRKRPISSQQVAVESTNIAGDGQADLENHGGPEKAVYAYPYEHFDKWVVDLGADRAFGPGSFGENLTIAGFDETTARIGDVWQWGDAVLQICQPRYPCYKLGMTLGNRNVVKLLVENGRTGWYMRVLEPGAAPISGPIELIERPEPGISVLEAHRARLPGADLDLVARVANAAGLASGLRMQFAATMNGSDN